MDSSAAHVKFNMLQITCKKAWMQSNVTSHKELALKGAQLGCFHVVLVSSIMTLHGALLPYSLFPIFMNCRLSQYASAAELTWLQSMNGTKQDVIRKQPGGLCSWASGRAIVKNVCLTPKACGTRVEHVSNVIKNSDWKQWESELQGSPCKRDAVITVIFSSFHAALFSCRFLMAKFTPGINCYYPSDCSADKLSARLYFKWFLCLYSLLHMSISK